jgi:hypothetical protein
MQANGFFEGLGEALGRVIRFIIDLFAGFFALIGRAGHDFLQGLSRTLGINSSFLSLVALAIGVLMLIAAGRALFRRRIVSGVVWLLLGLWLISWLVH